MKNTYKEQGARLRQMRRQKRVSQETVAREVGVTMRGYQAWERGEARPQVHRLERLAAYFETTPDFIEYGRLKLRDETPELASALDFGAVTVRLLGDVLRKLDAIEVRLDNREAQE